MWKDILCIVFSAVTANHLGLIAEAERLTGVSLKVVNCPKCLSFWAVLTYTLLTGMHPIEAIALSFLSAYAALWAELLEGCTDRLYSQIYGKILSAEDKTPDTEERASHELSRMRRQRHGSGRGKRECVAEGAVRTPGK